MAKSAAYKRNSDLSMNYDDDDDELSPLSGQRTIQETKRWDVFREMPVKQDTGSMESRSWLDISVKVMKVIAYLIVFTIVLGAAVVSKGSLFFMFSQLKRNKTVNYCNIQLGLDQQFVSTLPNEERLAWIWVVLGVFAVPEVGALIRSVRMVFFKSITKPTGAVFSLVFLIETLHTIGLVIFAFWILPYMDVLKGLMLTNCVCIIPGILSLMSRNKKEPKRILAMTADTLAIGAQLTGSILWPLLYDDVNIWLIPLATTLISLGWWENFVSEDSPIGFIKSLSRMKEKLNECRYTIYRIIPIWKMGLFLCCVLISLWIEGDDPLTLFHYFNISFGPRSIPVKEIEVITGDIMEFENVTMTGKVVHMPISHYAPAYVMLIQMLATYICYIFGKFACKIGIQGFSFALPINLVVPICVNLAIAACGVRNSDPCAFHNVIPDYLFFTTPPVYFLHEYVSGQMAWIWLLWLFSQTWITIHIWSSKCERLASTEKLFVSPMYNAILIDQSMAMNRRRDTNVDVKKEDFEAMEKERMAQYYDNISLQTDGSGSFTSVKSSDHITRIYACATMWHETKDEMMEFLKSIVRIDEDQCARRVAQKYLRIVDPDYYEFETHIFLDDAYELSDHSDDDSQVNRFVKLLIDTIDEAASEVHQTNIRIRPPKKYPTPYGGRLVWILPGKTKMICHLKDKAKIRHRKRWSQVMYMYYLLGHRLMELPIPVDRKEVMAENTYLLALDGDIDFKPQAVTLLIDLMKKNKNLGAACGRIHPVGDGPMVWYQKFEYAIGHWLQKATEHMIGCVLCSPGCFSLFRGKALMDDNVMKKYTLQSNQARHYVQYDQGEDRWLCTLLLQRGYRVEYSAASDAYTHAPEGFNEFFNQRRRWVPSTMANIIDLLADSKWTVRVNDNISMLYIVYQVLLMVGTILGPGTIFLMLVGAFNSAFRIPNLTAFYFNIIPILLFMIVCYFCKSEIQLMVAGLLSCFYGLVMAAVFVGIALQIMEDGWLAPTSLFFAMTILVFIITALMHPAEISCLLSIFVYYITIPSMYMLLVFYSLFNMNNVTWGTREVVQKRSAKELAEEKKEMEEEIKKAKKNTFMSYLQSKSQNDSNGSFEVSCSGLFKCLFCTHPKPAPEQVQLVQIANHLEKIEKKLEGVERSVDPQGLITNRRRTSVGIRSGELLNSVIEDAEDQIDSVSETSSLAPKEERDDLINPYWIEDPDLKKGEVDFLTTTEIQFWKDLIEKYLYPIEEDKEEKARISRDLKDLRDRCVFAFFMMNALFVLILFLLQLNQDELNIQWPFGGRTNVTYDELLNQVTITQEYLQLEPLGLVFVLFFGVVMMVQFIAMLFHRFGTLSHLLSSVELNWYFSNKSKDYSDDGYLNKHAVAIVKDLQKLDGFEENDNSEDQVGRRKTIHNLENARQRKNTVNTLDTAFKKRFFNLNSEDPTSGDMRKITLRRDTLRVLETRRDSLIAIRRQSQMHSGGRNSFRNSTTQPRRTRASLISTNMYGDSDNGHYNRGFEPALEEDDINQQIPRKSQVTFQMSY